jgi:hypothetical protein
LTVAQKRSLAGQVWFGRAGICAWTVVNYIYFCLAATRTAAANELVPVTSFVFNVFIGRRSTGELSFITLVR